MLRRVQQGTVYTQPATRAVQGSSVIREKRVARNNGHYSGGKDLLKVRTLGRRGAGIFRDIKK